MNINSFITSKYEKIDIWWTGKNKPNLHFTAENAEHAEKKDISVSYCSIERYALYPISPYSFRTRRLIQTPQRGAGLMKNKANLLDAQMNVNSLITKYYRKNDAFAVQKNKANSKPILKQKPAPSTSSGQALREVEGTEDKRQKTSDRWQGR
jgi:hypothetical protein